MRREKMNNKGFSLVELIIVIAIMAILSAALAPQLMKYIEKSRTSTDSSSCASIESCVNAALAEEAAYKAVAGEGEDKGIVLNIVANDSGTLTFTNYKNGTAITSTNLDPFIKELEPTLGSLKAPKQTGMVYYVVEIETKKNTDTASLGSGTTEVGRIKCYTKATEVKDLTEIN